MNKKTNRRITLRAVEVFVAVIEEQSISRAARRLGSSASAVSLQLSNLEAALGVRLIERSAQRFEITSAGKIFRLRALRILDELNGAMVDLSASNRLPGMIIRLAVIEDFDANILPQWLTALQSEFANLRFIVKSGPSHENYSSLNGRAADVILAVDAMDTVDWVEEHPILRDPYVIVRPGQIDMNKNSDELLQRPFVRYSREQHMGRQIEAQLRRTKFVPAREHEFSSTQAVLSMVKASNGWAITSASALLGATVSGLMASQLPIPAFSRTISLYARRDSLNDMPEKFSAILRIVFKNNMIEAAKRNPYALDPNLLPRLIISSN